MVTKAYGAHAADKPLEPIDIERRAPGPHDVQIEIAFCGVCHSDLHTVRSEWGGTLYPCVPGHEIVGHVSAVGGEVTQIQGRRHRRASAAWSTAASTAPSCAEGLEQYCENGFVGTYNGPTEGCARPHAGRLFAAHRRRREVRAEDPPSRGPARRRGAAAVRRHHHLFAAAALEGGPGKKVGIVGIGGLGHMGIKIAHAMGAHVVAFTTSESKRQDALDLGADEVVISRDKDEMAAHAGSFDFILDTVAASHSLDAFTAPAQARRHACAWSACPSIRTRRRTWPT